MSDKSNVSEPMTSQKFSIYKLGLILIVIGLASVLGNSLLPSLHINLGYLYLLREKFPTAEQHFQVANHLGNEQGFWGLAQVHHRTARPHASLEAFRGYLEVDESHQRTRLTYYFIGKNAYTLQRYDEAFEAWRKANASQYFVMLGHSARFAHNWQDALRGYEIADQITPVTYETRAWLLYTRGKLATEEGATSIAATYFQQATETDPENFDAYLALGVTRLSMRDLLAAENAFQHAAILRIDSFWPYFYLGKIEHQKDNCVDAVALLERANGLASTPYAPLYIALGRAASDCGQIDKARQNFERVLVIEPANQQIRKELERLQQ